MKTRFLQIFLLIVLQLFSSCILNPLIYEQTMDHVAGDSESENSNITTLSFLLYFASTGTDNAASTSTETTTSTSTSTDTSTDTSTAISTDTSTATSTTTWVQQAYIKASNAESPDYFGRSISIDGDTIVVGAYFEDSSQTTITSGTGSSNDNSAENSGAVYVYKRSGSTWEQEAYIKASNSEMNDFYGSSVSVDGDTIVVGAFREDSSQTTITSGTGVSSDNSASGSGAVYVYKRSGSTWEQEAYIKASNAEGGDGFGYSVDVKGDTIAVAAIYEDSNQTKITNGTESSSNNGMSDSGAVYVYKRTGNIWTQEAYIKASNAGSGDQFGESVSLKGDLLAVGSQYEDSPENKIHDGSIGYTSNTLSQSGAVFLYNRSEGVWTASAYVKASNSDTNDLFGSSVAVDGDTVVVGAPGEDSNQTVVTNGTTSSSNNSASGSGAAYVYRMTGNYWRPEAYIKASNAEKYDYFGSSVAVDGDTILVGAPEEDSNQTVITNGATSSSDNSASGAGAVYVYKRTGFVWAQEAYIKASNAELNDDFGRRVALDGDTLVIGTFSEDSGQTTITNGSNSSSDNSQSQAGAVYVYVRQ